MDYREKRKTRYSYQSTKQPVLLKSNSFNFYRRYVYELFRHFQGVTRLKKCKQWRKTEWQEKHDIIKIVRSVSSDSQSQSWTLSLPELGMKLMRISHRNISKCIQMLDLLDLDRYSISNVR